MTRWLRGVAASLLSAHALVAANQVAPPAPPQQATFRSATLVVESEIARDASGYYVFGYSPTNTIFDGAWRRIEVRVKRKGLSVRARRGYLASGAAPVLTRLDPTARSVGAASRNPGPRTGPISRPRARTTASI